MFIFPREGDQRSRSRSQPSSSWEGACEGEGPNFVSSNGAQVSFLILCNTSSSTYVSRRTIHFMKNLRLLAAESLSPLVVGLFSFPRWHEERVHSTSSYCENKIFGALSLWMSRSSSPRAYLYSMLLKSEKETEWTGGTEVKLQKW